MENAFINLSNYILLLCSIAVATTVVTYAPNINGSVGGISSATSLLLKGDGSDASTSIIDSSEYNHTVTTNGNVQIDRSRVKERHIFEKKPIEKT